LIGSGFFGFADVDVGRVDVFVGFTAQGTDAGIEYGKQRDCEECAGDACGEQAYGDGQDDRQWVQLHGLQQEGAAGRGFPAASPGTTIAVRYMRPRCR
jgi:hypothetical protein